MLKHKTQDMDGVYHFPIQIFSTHQEICKCWSFFTTFFLVFRILGVGKFCHLFEYSFNCVLQECAMNSVGYFDINTLILALSCPSSFEQIFCRIEQYSYSNSWLQIGGLTFFNYHSNHGPIRKFFKE